MLSSWTHAEDAIKHRSVCALVYWDENEKKINIKNYRSPYATHQFVASTNNRFTCSRFKWSDNNIITDETCMSVRVCMCVIRDTHLNPSRSRYIHVYKHTYHRGDWRFSENQMTSVRVTLYISVYILVDMQWNAHVIIRNDNDSINNNCVRG